MAGEEDQVKVLNLWSSPFGMRVLIALEEKGVQYEYQEEFLPHTKSHLLLQMNPVYKKIPILIHNGKPICESLVILQYIEEAWPHQSLLPSQPYARSQAQFWADFVDKKITTSGFRIVESKGEVQEDAKRDMVGYLDVLEGALGEEPYFGGQEFGFVDIAFIPIMCWFPVFENFGNFKIPMDTQFPRLKVWIQKCMERESVKKFLPEPDKLLEYARKRFVTD